MKKQIKSSLATKLFTIAVLIIVWFLAYNYLPLFAKWLSFDVFKLKQGSHLGEAIYFFLYDTPKVFLLLILVVFGVGIIRSFFTPERTRKLFQVRKEFSGNIIAAGLGIVTPFCTCSAVPLFIGFVEV